MQALIDVVTSLAGIWGILVLLATIFTNTWPKSNFDFIEFFFVCLLPTVVGVISWLM